MPRFTYLSVSKTPVWKAPAWLRHGDHLLILKCMPERQKYDETLPRMGTLEDSTLTVLFYPANASSVGHHGATLPLTC